MTYHQSINQMLLV